MWYEMPVAILSQADAIDVPTPQTCGEVEPALIGIGDDLYLSLGSDHTARDVRTRAHRRRASASVRSRWPVYRRVSLSNA